MAYDDSNLLIRGGDYFGMREKPNLTTIHFLINISFCFATAITNMQLNSYFIQSANSVPFSIIGAWIVSFHIFSYTNNPVLIPAIAVPNMDEFVIPPASSPRKRLATTPRAARIQRVREDILPKVSMCSHAKNISTPLQCNILHQGTRDDQKTRSTLVCRRLKPASQFTITNKLLLP